MQRKTAEVLGVIALACILLAGLGYILQRHAQQAESYPFFSSFRTLPEGASVLYEALSQTPGMTATRNTQALGTVGYRDAAILMLGYDPATLSGNGQWFSDVERLAGPGNRMIIGLVPHRGRFVQANPGQFADALKRWSISLAFVRESDLREEKEELASGWPMYFAKFGSWNVTRKDNGRAVVIERTFGKGSIVLLANSYLLSNSAMVENRQTTFLTELIGPAHQTIFDETHFGIEETGSIAALARRYRLQGLVLGLIATSILFIWKSASGFPPPWGGTQPAGSVMGEDSAAAFLNLLRRNIRKEDILTTCVDAWRKMYSRRAGAGLTAAVDLASRGSKSPVQAYAEIQQVLSQTGRIRPDGAQHNQS